MEDIMTNARALADRLENRAETLKQTAMNGRDTRFIKLLEDAAAALRAVPPPLVNVGKEQIAREGTRLPDDGEWSKAQIAEAMGMEMDTFDIETERREGYAYDKP